MGKEDFAICARIYTEKELYDVVGDVIDDARMTDWQDCGHPNPASNYDLSPEISGSKLPAILSPHPRGMKFYGKAPAFTGMITYAAFTPAPKGFRGDAFTQAEWRSRKMRSDLMMVCEQKRLYKTDGVKAWRWVDVSVAELSPDDGKELRCKHCHGEVKMPKQKAAQAPPAHIEHKRRADSENCEGGTHYLGFHRLSIHPVT